MLSSLMAAPAAAQSWRVVGDMAGLSVDGRLTGLAVACSGGRAEITLSGFDTKLQGGERYTAGVTVDDTAYLFETRARDDPRGPGSILVGAISKQVATPFVEALRRGRRAEVATPAGHYRIPLSGSGKALGSILPACPAP
ncbi:hypothetical protein [Aurantimonas sp. VKM B-3413]|uniref:hypothetical protein n=1 Tax=Aurantimonas sp. VKM B-3413 TaxID=2779401 RepID=UPI001E4F8288|nr:hypothetical protein [Aurantimonas sp. VKM B-3413]MCB8838714.1 hypothetical protein [Aurantimonas sp. VKM B-3413]